MGIFDSLFGGSTDPQFKQMSTLTPEQLQILNQLTGVLSGQIGQGVSSYPGAYTPGATGNQKQIYELVNSLLSGKGPLQGEGMDSLKSLMQPYDDTGATNYWNEAIKKPALDTWSEDTVPQIMEQFAAYDAAGSGPAMKAVANSGADLNANLGSTLASVLFQDKNAWQNRQLSADTAGLQYPQTLINSVLGAATQERGIQSEQGQEGYQDWMMEQSWANPWLQQLGLGLGTKAFENVAIPGASQKGIFGDIFKGITSFGGAAIQSPYSYSQMFA